MTRKPLLTRAEVVERAQSRRASKAAQAKKKPKARYKTAGGRHSDTAKLDWLRQQKCMVAENPIARWRMDVRSPEARQTPCAGRVEAHHDRHHGSRATDKRTAPLCEGHHTRNADSLHTLGRSGFQAFHALDMDVETSRYESEWSARSSSPGSPE